MATTARRIAVVLVVALMIGWPLSMAATGGVAAQDNGEDGELVDVDNGLSVWDRAILPLRADTTAGSAETVINAHSILIEAENVQGEQETTANRDQVAVYGNNAGEIPIDFEDASGANTGQFSDRENVQVIVAEFEQGTVSDEVGGLDALNDVVSPALDGDFETLRDEADQRDVTFEVHEVDQPDENGELNFDLSELQEGSPGDIVPGPYAVMLAFPTDDQNNGFSTNEDNLLELPGEADLVGVETVMVHEDESSLDISNAAIGETIEVDSTIGLESDDEDFTQSVLIYNEDTFLGSDERTVVNVDGELGTQLEEEDLTLKHTIATANGVGEMTEDGNVFGVSVPQRTVSGTVAVGDVVDLVTDEADLDTNREAIDPETEIDASGKTITDDGTIEVETFDNWTAGSYRVVHVAEDGTVDGVETSTQTIELDDDDEPELESIQLTLDETSLEEGETTAATVEATFSDDSTEDVTDETTIESDDTNVATVEGSTITAENPGSAAITATYTEDDITETDSVDLTVTTDAEPFFDVEIDEVIDEDGNDVTEQANAVAEGDEITTVVDVENIGGIEGTQDIEFRVGGDVIEAETDVTLGDGATTTFEFDYTTVSGDAPGVYIEVESDDDSDSASAYVGSAAEFEIDEFTVPETGTQNEQVTIDVTVENAGDLPGSVDVDLLFDVDADGAASLTETETTGDIAPGATDTVTFTPEVPAEPKAGEHTVTVEADLPSDSASDTVDIDYQDIQSGVDAAAVGDRVDVATPADGGDFEESVDVNVQDVIVRTVDEDLVLDSSTGEFGVELTASGAGIRGIEIQGSGLETGINAAAQSSRVRNVELSGFDTAVHANGDESVIRRAMISADEHAVIVTADDVDVGFNTITADGMTTVIDVNRADTTVIGNRIGPDESSADVGVDLSGENGGAELIGNTIAVAPDGEGDDEAAIEIDVPNSLGGEARLNNLDAPAGANLAVTGENPIDIRAVGDPDADVTQPFVAANNYDQTGALTIEDARGSGGGSASIQAFGTTSTAQTAGGASMTTLEEGNSAPTTLEYSDSTPGIDSDEVTRLQDDNGDGPVDEDDTSDDPNDPANYQITSLTLDPSSEIGVGDTVDVTATIENQGDLSGDQTIVLRIDGDRTDEEDLELDGSESEDVQFTYTATADDPDEISITVETDDDSQSSQLDVAQAPDFEVDNLNLDPATEITAGDDLDADATVENVGGDGSQDIELRIGGNVRGTAGEDYAVLATQTVDLDSSETETVEFDEETVPTTAQGINLLGPQEVSIASDDDDARFSPFTVNEPDVTFAVNIDAAQSTTSVTEGDTASVQADIENIDTQTDTQSVRFFIENDLIDTEEDIELDGGDSETVTFTYQTDSADIGDITAEVRSGTDSDTIAITVEEEDDTTTTTGGGGGGGTVLPTEPSVTSGQGVSIADGVATFTLTSMQSITFEDITAEGTVSVDELDGVPNNQPPLGAGQPFVTGFAISVPDTQVNQSATLQAEISDEMVESADVEAENLVILRAVDDGYQQLDTAVEMTDDGAVVEAETPGFSFFAVSAAEPEPDEETPDPEEEETPEPEEETPDPVEETPEPDDQAGFGLLVAILSLLAAALLALRRRRPVSG